MNLHDNFRYKRFGIINFVNLSGIDIDMIRVWRNNPEIRKWMFNKNIISKQEHISFIDKLKRDKNNIYWLIKDKFDRPLGVISLKDINYKKSQAYIGIYKSPLKYKYLFGLGRKLLDLLIYIASKKLGLKILLAQVYGDNIKAVNLYKKAGFKVANMRKNIVIMSLEKDINTKYGH